MNVLSLFSGIGGLELGLRLAEPAARCIAYVERDDYCRRVLRARMADGWLDRGPIFPDVCEFRGEPWRGAVDIICGGFPCQDISNAGKREGITGSRSGLWFEFARIIGEVGPGLVFVENVAALVNRGLDVVLGALASLGFDAEWGVFSACEVGAPHMRKRLFLLAYSQGGDGRTWRLLEESEEWRAPLAARGRCGDALARGGQPSSVWAKPEPCFPRMALGLPDQVDRIRVTGNAVVPLQAAHAYRTLAVRAGLI